MNFRNEFVDLKDSTWIENQKIAGKAVSECLKHFNSLLKNSTKNISLKNIESDCLDIINSFKCEPTFYNYNGFPGVVCLSVNDRLVHGIPYDYILKPGDVVTLDLGATFNGAIADAAFTCIYQEPINPAHVEMLKMCKKALDNAISEISVGKNIGIIGHTIYETVKNTEFGLVTDYGGHGIGYFNKPHDAPFIANKANKNEGIVIHPGLAIAIEPILVMNGITTTKVLEDKWTVVSSSGDVGCHFEHSVTLDENGNVIIITEHNLEI